MTFEEWWEEQLEASPQVDLLRRAFAAGRASVEAAWNAAKEDALIDKAVKEFPIAAPSHELTDNDILVEVAGNPLANGQDAIDFARAVLAAAKRKATQSQKIEMPKPIPNLTISADWLAPSQEPDSFGKYLVERNHRQVAEERLSDAAAQIAELQKAFDAQCVSADKLFEAVSERDEQIAKLEAALPDDFSESKDWKHADALGRIEWLKSFHKSLAEDRDMAWDHAAIAAEKCAAAEKDAARYRWLRDECMDDNKTLIGVINGFINYEDPDYIYGEQLDAAIDAAMKLSPVDTAEGE